MTLDYLRVFEGIPEADLALAARTRAVVERDVAPRVVELYEAGRFPDAVIPGLAEAGLFGASVAGIGDASPIAWGLALRELERVDSGLRSFVSVQACLAMGAIARYGSEDQRRRWLPPMAAGAAIGCFALTEPNHGSDPAGMETTATPLPGGGYRIDGHKRWSTNGTIANVAVVWAQTDPPAGARGVRGFAIPLPHPGVTVRPLERKLSLRMSYSAEILFENVEVGPEVLLPETRGLGAALSCLNEARYSIIWGVVGTAEACYEAALARVRGREQFGRPLAGFQLVQARLVDTLDAVTTSQLVARQVAELKASGRLRHQHISFAKRHNVAAAQRAAAQARALFGAEGITGDAHVMRHMANLESVATYEGTDDIHTLAIGADVTGYSAFR